MLEVVLRVVCFFSNTLVQSPLNFSPPCPRLGAGFMNLIQVLSVQYTYLYVSSELLKETTLDVQHFYISKPL